MPLGELNSEFAGQFHLPTLHEFVQDERKFYLHANAMH